MNQCPKCNSWIVPKKADTYYCKECKYGWKQEVPGGKICDSCGDVVMYCKCYEDVIKEINEK